MVLAANLQCDVGRKGITGLGDPVFAAEHLPCQDQCLGPRAAVSEAAIHQQLVSTCTQQNSPQLQMRVLCDDRHYFTGRIDSVPSARSTIAATRASASANFASQ